MIIENQYVYFVSSRIGQMKGRVHRGWGEGGEWGRGLVYIWQLVYTRWCAQCIHISHCIVNCVFKCDICFVLLKIYHLILGADTTSANAINL